MVEVIRSGDTIKVKSNYDTNFIRGAKNIQGRWKSPYWVFPAENEKEIKDLLLDVYGECGEPIATVTLEIDVNQCDECDDSYDGRLTFGSFTLATRRSRDASVRLASNAMLIEGGFPCSGGSMRYPRCEPKNGTILRVKNVPQTIYERMDKKGIRLVQDVDKEALLEERESLLARVEEINNLLKELEEMR